MLSIRNNHAKIINAIEKKIRNARALIVMTHLPNPQAPSQYHQFPKAWDDRWGFNCPKAMARKELRSRAEAGVAKLVAIAVAMHRRTATSIG